jgi:hypothetical protein
MSNFERQDFATDVPPTVEALYDTCNTLLEAHMPPDDLALATKINLVMHTKTNPRDVRARLMSGSLCDLMLPDGASLSIDNPDGRASRKKSADAEERLRAQWLGDAALSPEDEEEDNASDDANRIGMPDLQLHAGTADLVAAGIKVSCRTSEQIAHWREARLSIFFRYANTQHQAFELVTARTDSYTSRSGLGVKLDANVTSPSYYSGFEYRGHMPIYRLYDQDKQDTGQEVFELIETAHDLAIHAAKE